MNIAEIIILGLIQGITEFLPISSSGHLAFVPALLGWDSHDTSFDICLHMGTLLALVIYFRAKLRELSRGVVQKNTESYRFISLVILASIPAVVSGFLFKDWFEGVSQNMYVVAFDMAIWGVFFWIADWVAAGRSKEGVLSFKNALLVGVFQIFSLFRGTSRSGSCMVGGVFGGLSLKQSSEFSFFLGIPIIAGAVVLQLLHFDEVLDSGLDWWVYLIGFLTSFVSGIISIHFLLQLISRAGLKWFGVYRILIAIVILLLV